MAMSIETVEIETLAADRPVDDRWTLQWTPIVAGALIACAVSFIMISFGATVGLGVSSAAPTWRDASVALWVLSGIYLILQALISFGCGGYLTGRCRLPYGGIISEATEKRDGLHGVASWALAVILGAALATLVVMGASRPTRLTQPATTTEPSLLSYEIDHLFRSPRRPPNSDLSPIRAEAGRILLTSSSHSGVSPDDRAYLAQLVSATTGLSGAHARQHHHSRVLGCRGVASRSHRSLDRSGSRRPTSRWHAARGLDGTFKLVQSTTRPVAAPVGSSAKLTLRTRMPLHVFFARRRGRRYVLDQ
jgi:hypothetical protein